MRLSNLVILLILMSAFAIGVSVTDIEKQEYHNSLENATIQISNITLTNDSSSSYVNSFIFIVEKYIQFIATLLFEVMKIGIDFGHDNPQYFEPDFIILIMKFLIWLTIISLLIKPIGWLIAFMIVGVIALKDKLKKSSQSKSKANKK